MLIDFPCSIGDTVYILIDSVDIPYIKEQEVIAFEVWAKNKKPTIYIRTQWGLYEHNERVFTQKESAEAKLTQI